MTAISRKPAIDVVKQVNDQTAAVVARAKSNWGLGTLNPDEFPLDQAPHAYEIFQKKEDGAIKILLQP